MTNNKNKQAFINIQYTSTLKEQKCDTQEVELFMKIGVEKQYKKSIACHWPNTRI